MGALFEVLTSIDYASVLLEDEKELSDYGITSGTEVFVGWFPHEGDVEDDNDDDKESSELTEELSPRGAEITFEVEKRELMNKARAKILYEWDGFTPGSLGTGSRLYTYQS